jgi:membrane-associated phospholipid phosphatase
MRSILIISLTALALCLLSVLYFDTALSQYFAHPDLAAFKKACREVTDLAEVGPYFFISAVTYLGVRWIVQPLNWISTHRKRLDLIRDAGAFSFISLLVAGALVHLLKFLFGRARPHIDPSYLNLQFDPFNLHWHWHSLPSGHAQVSFVIATLLALAFPRYKLGFYLAGACLAFTRVPTHQHFLSDVILGGLIGYLVPTLLYKKLKHRWFQS